jgi:CIC family chloride channel protein
MARLRQWLRESVARALAPLARRDPSERLFLLLLPVVGVVVGLTTVVTAHLISFIQARFWGSEGSLLDAAQQTAWWMRIIIPTIGGLIVGGIGYAFKVQTRGGGITTIIQTLALKGGVLSLRQTAPRDTAAMFTIATGGSLGREGAMAMLASALASRIGRQYKLSTKHLRMLVCGAAAAALAAVYNAPIGGSLFALELLMGNFALEVLGPVVVVSVISTLVFRSCMGSLPRFEVPHYEMVSGWELVFYLGLGVLAGVAALWFVRVLFAGQDLFEKLPLPAWLKPALGMALVGVIGIWWPQVYGNGFEAVNLTLSEKLPLTLLLALLPMKYLASSLSFGSGAAGGLFTPSLMIGAVLGAIFGYGVHAAFPNVTADYGAYALVGMGGVLAGTTHAPLTAIMMIFEQTNSYQIILPLMFVCVISHVTVRLLHGRSLDEEALRRRGVTLPRGPEAGIMQTVRVADIMHPEVDAVKRDAPFAAVVEWFLKAQRNWLYVVDGDGRFLGAISLHGIKDMLHQTESLGVVVAADLVNENFSFATPNERLADVMDRLWQQPAERLPVLNDATDRKLIGWMSKRDLIGVYSQEILHKRQLLGHFIVTDDGGKRDAYVELPEGFELRAVELPPHYAGKTVAQLAPRSRYGVHVLAVKRRDALTGCDIVRVPDPQMELLAGDRLVIIGTFENIASFMSALATQNAGSGWEGT